MIIQSGTYNFNCGCLKIVWHAIYLFFGLTNMHSPRVKLKSSKQKKKKEKKTYFSSTTADTWAQFQEASHLTWPDTLSNTTESLFKCEFGEELHPLHCTQDSYQLNRMGLRGVNNVLWILAFPSQAVGATDMWKDTVDVTPCLRGSSHLYRQTLGVHKERGHMAQWISHFIQR